jgi:hypothetical protein
MEVIRIEDFINPYKDVKLKTYVLWMTLLTIANYSSTGNISSKYVRSYLAILVWLLPTFNSDRSGAQRLMIVILYLEFNPIERVVDAVNHSANIIKAALLCMSLSLILVNPEMNYEQAFVLTILLAIAEMIPYQWEIEIFIPRIIEYLKIR